MMPPRLNNRSARRTAAFLALLGLSAPVCALAQDGGAGEPAEQPSGEAPTPVPGQTSRPGVLTRPTVPTTSPQPTSDGGDSEGTGTTDPGAQPAPSGGADGGSGVPTARPGGTPQVGENAPPTNGAPPTGQVQSGPPVLDVQDIAPDVGQLPANFTEPFDPFNPPRNARVNIDFNQADLSDVVMWISALTGENFIIADTISASKKITIISPEPVTIAEAYRAFLAALNMNGLTIVPFGRFQKIVESSTAQRQALEPTDSYGDIPADDRMVTHIHQLRHVAWSDVQAVVEALKSDAAQVVPYEPTNTIIITESGVNLRRILEILALLDVPSGQERINIYQVRYADAEELKALLLEVFEPDSETGTVEVQATVRRSSRRRNADDDNNSESEAAAAPASGNESGLASVSQIIADTRTNQLLIIANDRAYEQVADLIEQLDVPIPGEGQIHVMFLENADATELSSTLSSLTQSLEQAREQSGGGAVDEGGSDGADGAAGFGISLSGDVSITSDESTNSLVIVASLRDFLALQSVVRQLDRRRQQVYVEAVIMELTLNRQNQFGVAFNGGALPSLTGEDVPLFGASTVGPLSSVALDPSSLMGLAVGLRGPEIPGSEDLLGIGIPSFGAILQAMQTDNDVNVLSTPHILTLDNEEAEIVVGENIPFISGIGGGLSSGLGSLGALGDLGNLDTSSLGSAASLLGGLGGGFPSVQVQRQDVALTLRIKPQINESSFVRLEIEEEVEDVQSIDPVLGPRTTTRQARTTVVVQDQQTIVIGGLMRDSQIQDVSKVPVLGDIPIIGHLFRHTSNRSVKTNLLLLLTPYIIRDPSDFREIFRRKMEEREEFVAYFGSRSPEYVQAIDYARKDGPMQSMLETIAAAVTEADERRRAFESPTQEQEIAPPVSEPLRIDVTPDEDTDEPAPLSVTLEAPAPVAPPAPATAPQSATPAPTPTTP